MSLTAAPARCTNHRRRKPGVAHVLRLFAVLAVMAVAVVACRDRPPTQSLTVIKVSANVCYTGGGPTCICFPGSVGTYPNCSLGESPPLVTGDSVGVFCKPHALVRGDTVSCLIYTGRRTRFTVTSRLARDPSPSPTFVVRGGRDTTRSGQDTVYVAGDTARWRGPAVVSSRLTIRVKWTDSMGLTHSPSASDAFTVTPRVLPEYAIVNPPKVFGDSVNPRYMTPYPFHKTVDANGADSVDSNGIPIPPVATYGFFVAATVFHQLLQPGRYAEEVGSGPNASIWWFRRFPPLVDSTQVWIHPALKGGGAVALARFWYGQQDGGTVRETFPHDTSILHDTITKPDILVRHVCDTADVRQLKSLVEGHEGTGTAARSHYSILSSTVAGAGLKAAMESSFVQVDLGRLHNVIGELVVRVIDSYNSTTGTFEQPEMDRIFGKIGKGALASDLGAIHCRIRFDSSSVGTIVPLSPL